MNKTEIHEENIQYAALPWRKVGGVIEILVVTTRNTKKWIVPKGWPIGNKTPSECAAHEALEEAGLLGEVAAKAVGSFRYRKRRKSGEVIPCKVYVFPMRVAEQLNSWIEQGTREICWCSHEEALVRITNSSLRRLIAKFVNTSPT
jgi:8-oxo-dGTP pyrophosphatase MutT (NUDIX family)